jgi:hypothetical protein
MVLQQIWHCLKVDKKVFDAAYTWVEHADWIPGVLTGTDHPSKLKRCRWPQATRPCSAMPGAATG